MFTKRRVDLSNKMIAEKSLTETQVFVIESSIDSVKVKLEEYLNASKKHPDSLKGFFFVLHVALNEQSEATANIAKLIYEHSESKQIIPFFELLNELITGSISDYKMCEYITSPKLMVDQSPESIEKTLQSFGMLLKQGILDWINTDDVKPLYNKKAINALYRKHSALIEGPQGHSNPPLKF